MHNLKSGNHVLEVPEFKIAYFPVPKTASTSLKFAFYKLNFGKDYDADEGRSGIHIDYFNTKPFFSIDISRYEDYSRIAIIRDPAQRIVSAYTDRVVWLQDLSEDRLDMDLARKLGVGPDPTRAEFICNLNKYRLLSKSIRHHTEPFTTYLGHDLRYFTDVVRIGEIPEFAAQIEALTGREFKIGHHRNTWSSSGPNLAMKKAARQSLLKYCAGDYALMRDYFKVPKVLLR